MTSWGGEGSGTPSADEPVVYVPWTASSWSVWWAVALVCSVVALWLVLLFAIGLPVLGAAGVAVVGVALVAGRIWLRPTPRLMLDGRSLHWETWHAHGTISLDQIDGIRVRSTSTGVLRIEQHDGDALHVPTAPGLAPLLRAALQERPDLTVDVGWYGRLLGLPDRT